jgi:hypothetical protein
MAAKFAIIQDKVASKLECLGLLLIMLQFLSSKGGGIYCRRGGRDKERVNCLRRRSCNYSWT